MYERMLNKGEKPTLEEMAAHCGGMTDAFCFFNEWLSLTYKTAAEISFPYGDRYGWGVAHRAGKKLVCNLFAETDAFTVMLRLSDAQFASVYDKLREYARQYIDDRYPCGDGGWIHYRVAENAQLEDVQKLLTVKCCK